MHLVQVMSVSSDAFQSERCADLLKALSEPVRLRIIDVLRHGEKSVGEIAEQLETELVTVSHHLGILKQAGFVSVQRRGRFMVYRVREEVLKQTESAALPTIDLGCCRIELPDQTGKRPAGECSAGQS